MSAAISYALLTVVDSQGNTLERHRLRASQMSTLRIGRSFSCDVIVDDPHAAAEHASLQFDQSGSLILQDMGTINGTWLDEQRISSHNFTAPAEHKLRIGQTHLSLRTQEAQIATELPLAVNAPSKASDGTSHEWGLQPFFSHKKRLALFALLVFADILFSGWINQTTTLRDIWSGITAMALGQMLMLLAWTALWALISRVASGRPKWIIHASIALSIVLAVTVINTVIEFAGFAASSILPSQLAWWIWAIFGGLLIYLHIRAATHLSEVRSMSMALLLPAALLGMTYWQSYGTQAGREALQQTNSISLLPPQLRLVNPSAPDVLFKEARAMKTDIIKQRDIAKEEGFDSYED